MISAQCGHVATACSKAAGLNSSRQAGGIKPDLMVLSEGEFDKPRFVSSLAEFVFPKRCLSLELKSEIPRDAHVC
jgi:hypothetical protein